MSISKALAELL